MSFELSGYWVFPLLAMISVRQWGSSWGYPPGDAFSMAEGMVPGYSNLALMERVRGFSLRESFQGQ